MQKVGTVENDNGKVSIVKNHEWHSVVVNNKEILSAVKNLEWSN